MLLTGLISACGCSCGFGGVIEELLPDALVAISEAAEVYTQNWYMGVRPADLRVPHTGRVPKAVQPAWVRGALHDLTDYAQQYWGRIVKGAKSEQEAADRVREYIRSSMAAGASSWISYSTRKTMLYNIQKDRARPRWAIVPRGKTCTWYPIGQKRPARRFSQAMIQKV